MRQIIWTFPVHISVHFISACQSEKSDSDAKKSWFIPHISTNLTHFWPKSDISVLRGQNQQCWMRKVKERDLFIAFDKSPLFINDYCTIVFHKLTLFINLYFNIIYRCFAPPSPLSAEKFYEISKTALTFCRIVGSLLRSGLK